MTQAATETKETKETKKAAKSKAPKLRTTTETMLRLDPTSLVIVGIDTKDGAEHPLYDERIKLPVENEMVANVRYYGIIEPVVVLQDGNHYHVIDGRQRVRAARRANELLRKAGETLIKVPCVLKKIEASKVMGVMVSANEQRTDDELLTKAAKALRMVERVGEEETAVAFGVSKLTIKNWCHLATAHPKVRKAVEDADLRATVVYELAKLPVEEQEEALKTVLSKSDGGKTTQGKNAVRNVRRSSSGEEPAYDPPGKRLLKKLVEARAELPIDPAVFLTIRWILGEGSPSAISGLSAAIREIEGDGEEE